MAKGRKLSKVDQDHLNSMIQKMKSYYQWDESFPFVQKSSQNCSDMLVSVGMLNFCHFNSAIFIIRKVTQNVGMRLSGIL